MDNEETLKPIATLPELPPNLLETLTHKYVLFLNHILNKYAGYIDNYLEKDEYLRIHLDYADVEFIWRFNNLTLSPIFTHNKETLSQAELIKKMAEVLSDGVLYQRGTSEPTYIEKYIKDRLDMFIETKLKKASFIKNTLDVLDEINKENNNVRRN